MPIHSSTLGKCKIRPTAAWGSTGTQPTIGNGAVIGWSILSGEFLWLYIDVLMGSTTTYGTGTYAFTMETGGDKNADTHPGSATVSWQPCAAVAVDSGTAYRHGTAVFFAGLDYCQVITQGTAGYWTPTVPHTWANTDELSICGVIKVKA